MFPSCVFETTVFESIESQEEMKWIVDLNSYKIIQIDTLFDEKNTNRFLEC